MSLKGGSKLIRLQISEPWDFDIPGKGNILDARIEGICQGPPERNWEGEYLLLSLPRSIKWKGETIKQLLIAPRHEGATVKDLLKGQDMMVGIARVKPSISLTTRSFSTEQVDYFAIGSTLRK